MEQNAQDFNPWVSMWTKPRATIRQIIDTDPGKSVIFLAMLEGIARTFGRLMRVHVKNPSEPLWMLFLGGALFGIVYLYVMAFALPFVGKIVGGKGNAKSVMAALAWGRLPLVYFLLATLLQWEICGTASFARAWPDFHDFSQNGLILLALSAAKATVGIWSVFTLFSALGEAQGLSAWSAFANYLLTSLLLVSAVVGLVVAMWYLFR